MTDVSPPVAVSRALDNRPVANVRLFYRFCRFLCQVTTILLVKARVFGRRNVPTSGGLLLVCNHQSFMDPILATMALDREGNYMARDSLFKGPFGALIGSLNAFPVKRNTADLGAIKEAMRRIKQGRIVLVFPEGTRSEDGRIGVMLPGLAAIAKKVEAPIVPTLVDGMYRAWPRTRILPGPGDVIVEYDRPIQPQEYAHLTADQLMAMIRERLIAMQERWHSRVPRRALR